MIEIEVDIDHKNNFVENLHHQIIQKYFRFYKNIPDYNQKLDAMNFQLKLKGSIFKIRNNFELTQIRKNYGSVINEFEDRLQNK